MKKIAIALLALTIASPAMASHNHRRLRSGDFEVKPSHCVFDKIFDTWNCWYTPVPKRKHYHHHHYHRDYYRTPWFRPNEHNEHGVPCYFYKKDGWCF